MGLHIQCGDEPLSLYDIKQLFYGWDDEDDTLRTGVDNIHAAYVADMLAARRAADELRFADWVRSQ